MSRFIQKLIYIVVVVWATIQLYEVKATYPYLSNVDMVKEYWYYVLAIGVAMSQIMDKDNK